MKIDNKILRDFISKKLDTVGGEGLSLQTTDKGITMTSLEETNVMTSFHTLDKSTITDFKPINTFTVNSINRLDNVMKSLINGKQSTITVTDNTLVIANETETQTLCLMDSECIHEVPQFKLEYETELKVKTSYLKDIKRLADTFGGEKKNPIGIVFMYENDKLSYELEFDGEKVVSKPLFIPSNFKGTHRLKVSLEYILRIIKKLSDDYVIFSIKSDYPIRIKESIGTFIQSTYILAPRIENEEDEPPQDLENPEQKTDEGDTSE